MPKLSVIIPTHKRADILTECLRCLERQTVAHDIEVIIVSDGHDDKTSALFANSTWHVSVKFFEVEKSQQGSARNEGLRHATGDIVLFIGDDIFLEPDACEVHLSAHCPHPQPLPRSGGGETSAASGEGAKAVLGFTTWDPTVGITPVMTWLEKSGWQFGYPTLNRRHATGAGPFVSPDVQHRYTYTSHISLPLSVAKKHLFRTDVHLYGWEDVEWGMRLKNAGVRLLYEPRTKALHHHRMTLEDSLKRMEILGRSAVEIQKKVPEFDRVPKGWKLCAYRVLSLLPTMAGKHRKAFLQGMMEVTSVSASS